MGQINLRLRKHTWATAPDAVGNDGYMFVATDINNQVFMSDNARYKPLSGIITLKLETLATSITQLSSNTATPGAVSAFKLTIPRSSTNGSLLQANDVVRIRYQWERQAAAGATLRRHVRVGTDATVPLNNTLLSPSTTGSSSALSINEELILHVISTNNINIPGRAALNQFDTTDTSAGTNNNGTTISDMNNAVTYIDVCPVWTTSGGGESAIVRFCSAYVEVY